MEKELEIPYSKHKRIILLLSFTITVLVIMIISILLFQPNNSDIGNYGIQNGYNLSKRKTIQKISSVYFSVIVDKDGRTYLMPTMDIDYMRIGDDKKENVKKAFTNVEEKKFMIFSESKKVYNLNTQDVLSAYSIQYKLFNYFVFLLENGKVSYINLDSIINSGTINVQNVENIDNIVTVIENGLDLSPYFVTSDGEEILVDDYLK